MITIARAGDYAIERWGESDGDAYCFRLKGTQLPWPAFARGLREREEIRSLLTLALRESEEEAFFWECSPWKTGVSREPSLEFVVVPTTAFAGVRAAPDAFGAHFDESEVARFDSLGGDARLVAPAPTGRRDIGLHLASFVRNAPPDRIDALWIAVGEEIAAWRRAKRGDLWLSTSGLGVPWLHVRLDSRPKYYTHAAYR
jgi:hypothetical protein